MFFLLKLEYPSMCLFLIIGFMLVIPLHILYCLNITFNNSANVFILDLIDLFPRMTYKYLTLLVYFLK